MYGSTMMGDNIFLCMVGVGTYFCDSELIDWQNAFTNDISIRAFVIEYECTNQDMGSICYHKSPAVMLAGSPINFCICTRKWLYLGEIICGAMRGW